METSRRRFMIGLTAGAGLALLAACGGPPALAPAAATPGAGRGAARPAITMWCLDGTPEITRHIRETVAAAAGEGDFDGTVEFIDYEPLRIREQMAAQAGTLPDLSLTDFATNWAQAGRARDVNQLYHEIGRQGGGWYEVAESLSQQGGRRIGLPISIDVVPLFLRQDRFADAGFRLPLTSFDALVAGCRKLTGGNRYGFGSQFGAGAWTLLLNVLFAHGGRLFARDGTPAIDTPQNRAALTTYRDLVTKYQVMPPDVLDWDWERQSMAYRVGQVAATGFDATLLYGLRQETTEVLAGTAIVLWPSATDGPATAAAGSLQLVINQDSRYPEQALQVARKLLSPERYAGLAAVADPFVFAPLKGYRDLDTFTNDPWRRQIQHEVIPSAVSLYADGARTPLLEAIGPVIDAELRRVVADNLPPAEALATIERQARAEAAKLVGMR